MLLTRVHTAIASGCVTPYLRSNQPTTIAVFASVLHDECNTEPSIHSEKSEEKKPVHHWQEEIFDIRQNMAQFTINSLLQVVAFALAIAFGVFAVRSVDVGEVANHLAMSGLKTSMKQTTEQNQLSLLSFCLSVDDTNQVGS